MRLTIDDVAYGGDGVAHDPACGTVFVPGAYTGEIVEAAPVSRHKRFTRARLVRVLEPSPDRIVPETPIVPGMAYASLAYPAEVALKARQLRALLTRIGKLPADLPLRTPRPSPQHLHYRNKLTLRWDGRRLGYVGDDNRTILDTPHCPLSRPEINAALADVRRSAALRALHPGARVCLRHAGLTGTRVILGDAPGDPEPLMERVGGLTLRYGAADFFQVNLPALELLLADCRAALAGRPPTLALDLYCGVGLFGLALPASDRFGIDCVPTSIANAQANAQANRLPATYRCARTEALLDSLPHDADLWIVDPPRAGLAPAVRERLLRLRPRRILYVSCGPDTLARDLAALTPAYAIDAIRLVDFFPRTPHFETLTLLSAN